MPNGLLVLDNASKMGDRLISYGHEKPAFKMFECLRLIWTADYPINHVHHDIFGVRGTIDHPIGKKIEVLKEMAEDVLRPGLRVVKFVTP
jgi:hypothetical protein